MGSAANGIEKEILDYQSFGIGVRELAQIVDDSGFVPDVVLCIARGGLPIGGALAYALGTKNVGVINVEFYVGVDERLEVPEILPPLLNVVELQDLRVLVADDVADTGHTLDLVMKVVGDVVREVRSAVIYEKSRSVIKADYVWRRTDKWIVFPWSADPPVTANPRSAPELTAAG